MIYVKRKINFFNIYYQHLDDCPGIHRSPLQQQIEFLGGKTEFRGGQGQNGLNADAAANINAIFEPDVLGVAAAIMGNVICSESAAVDGSFKPDPSPSINSAVIVISPLTRASSI